MSGHGKNTVRTYLYPHMLQPIAGRLTPEQIDRVRPKAKAFFARIEASDFGGYAPVSEVSELYDAIEAEVGVAKTAEIVRASTEEGTAPAVLNSFLRLVIKFMPPSVFARKCPEFYAKDISAGKLKLESFDSDARRFVVTVSDGASYHYLAPGLVGCFTCFMRAMGHPNVNVVEELGPPPAPQNRDDYRIVVTW